MSRPQERSRFEKVDLGISQYSAISLKFYYRFRLVPFILLRNFQKVCTDNIRGFTIMDVVIKKELLGQCDFPKEWQEWDMLPDAMLEELYELYQSNTEEEGGYRNFRLDAFFYWMERELTEIQVKKLFRLSFFEKSGNHMRSSINRHKDCTESLRMELFGYTKQEIPKFTKNKLAELLDFPEEWLAWGMYPDELFLEHRKSFQPGNESDSENERNEVFHYWLSRELTEDQLIKLVQLSQLDPDPLMVEKIQNHIQKHKNCTPKVKKMLQQ